MKFDDLDKAMRVYETAQDYCVLPGIYNLHSPRVSAANAFRH